MWIWHLGKCRSGFCTDLALGSSVEVGFLWIWQSVGGWLVPSCLCRYGARWVSLLFGANLVPTGYAPPPDHLSKAQEVLLGSFLSTEWGLCASSHLPILLSPPLHPHRARQCKREGKREREAQRRSARVWERDGKSGRDR